MKTLTGSEKQIEWANTIRNKKIGVINALIDKGNAQMQTLEGEAKTKAEQSRTEVLARVEKLKQIDSAKFWIDARHDSVQMLMKAA